MSQGTCCSFCEQLPCIADPRRGSGGRCPLCRQDLWTMPNGVTHRVVAADDPAAPRQSRVPLFAGVAVGLLAGACVAIVAGWSLTRPAPQSPAPAPVAVQPVRPVAQAPVVVERVELPLVAVKRAIPANAARVKPAKSMEPVAKAEIKPVPFTFMDEAPRTKGVGSPIPVAWKWSYEHITEEMLNGQLSEVPQLDFEPEYAKKSKSDLAKMAKDILSANEKGKDAYLKTLIKERTDLAGLPFLLGNDCALDNKQAKVLAVTSLKVRSEIGVKARTKSQSTAWDKIPEDADPIAYAFWSMHKPTLDSLPALTQILSVQKKDFRYLLAKNLKDVKDAKATQTLAKLALFDLNQEVRRQALKELASRPKEEYRGEILKAFRYPWAPIARHASEAVVFLQLKEMLPDLVQILNEPDPTAPFTIKTKDGQEKTVVRELVRINHHRNCLLCHAPVDAKITVSREIEIPLGPVTSMQDELPPTVSPVYYSARSGITLVRADVTYLRQDFSVMQQVKGSRYWPSWQRFDFFVREREVSGKTPVVTAPEESAHVQAVLLALHGLTGKALPARANSWQEEVRASLEDAKQK